MFTIDNKFTPTEILDLYHRFLTLVNDWYGASSLGTRERFIRPNSFIGLNTYFPSMLKFEYAEETLSFDIEYEFGVLVKPSTIRQCMSIKNLFDIIALRYDFGQRNNQSSIEA